MPPRPVQGRDVLITTESPMAHIQTHTESHHAWGTLAAGRVDRAFAPPRTAAIDTSFRSIVEQKESEPASCVGPV